VSTGSGENVDPLQEAFQGFLVTLPDISTDLEPVTNLPEVKTLRARLVDKEEQLDPKATPDDIRNILEDLWLKLATEANRNALLKFGGKLPALTAWRAFKPLLLSFV